MKQIAIFAAALGAAWIVAAGGAQTPGENPFPASQVAGVFVSAQTVTGPGSSLGAGAVSNRFTRGSSVVFRVFAGDVKSGHVLTGADVKFFYVQIPGQPNVKLAYSGSFKATDPVARLPWTATWTIPADYPLGLVVFRVLLMTNSHRYGSFVQMPVTTAMLTVIA